MRWKTVDLIQSAEIADQIREGAPDAVNVDERAKPDRGCPGLEIYAHIYISHLVHFMVLKSGAQDTPKIFSVKQNLLPSNYCHKDISNFKEMYLWCGTMKIPKIILFITINLLSMPVMALIPVSINEIPRHLESGYEYMLKPDQALVVSVIKVRESWHVILIQGEDLCPGFSNILEPDKHQSTVCDDIRFYIGELESGGKGIFAVKN